MNSNELLLPDGYACLNPGNSFLTNWLDKRSAMSVAISVVFSGVNPPDGYLTLETSNSKDIYGGMGVGPANTSDASTFPGSSVTVTTTGITKWDVTTAERWIRVRYAAHSDVSGLTVYVVANAPYSSPG